MSGKKYYVGQTPEQMLKKHRGARFFYGIRAEGDELIITKLDALDANDIVIINKIGDDPTQDFLSFRDEEDFFEGRDEFHNSRYGNLKYEQWKWTDADYTYYVDDNGELTLRVYQGLGEGEVTIPKVPIRPVQVDYRRAKIYANFDNNGITFDNSRLTFDNKDTG